MEGRGDDHAGRITSCSDFQLELMGEKCEVQEATKFCQCRISETRRPCAKLIKESIKAHSQSCSQEVLVC